MPSRGLRGNGTTNGAGYGASVMVTQEQVTCPCAHTKRKDFVMMNTHVEDAKQALMATVQAHTQQRTMRGGPTCIHKICEGEEATWYPVAAVLAALDYPSWETLQEDWGRRFWSQRRSLPAQCYLQRTTDGHYTVLLSEQIIVEYLALLSNAPVAKAYQEALEEERIRSWDGHEDEGY
jgi:hypothetical protein